MMYGAGVNKLSQVSEDTLVVFTAESPEDIINSGGSQRWALDHLRARQCTWLVCAQNQHNPDPEFTDASQPHGAAFLLAKISTLTLLSEEAGQKSKRWLVEFDEYALIDLPNVWQGWRNPVRYTNLEDLGISLEGIEFHSVPVHDKVNPRPIRSTEPRSPLTIAEAKKSLAAAFGVKQDAVEITIRG